MMITYMALFLLSLVFSIALTPLSIRLAHLLGAVDVPSHRKVHTAPIPRLGGVAIFAAVVLAVVVSSLFDRSVFVASRQILGVLIGVLIILPLGLCDDARNLKPMTKLAFQTSAATAAVLLGIRFDLASNPFVAHARDYFDLGILAIPLSIIWIVAMTNAMNLIDGLDGLATGIALVTSLTLFLVSVETREGVPFFYLAIAGASLGFLRYNRHPAKVFLGDTGSMFLGFALGCLSIAGFQKSVTVSAFLIPVIVFGIPIFDSIVAVSRRYLNNTGLAVADRQHLHHKLMDLGLTQWQAVLSLYFISVLLGIIAFAFTVKLDKYAAVIVIAIGSTGAFLARELNLLGVSSRGMERGFKARTGASAQEPPPEEQAELVESPGSDAKRLA